MKLTKKKIFFAKISIVVLGILLLVMLLQLRQCSRKVPQKMIPDTDDTIEIQPATQTTVKPTTKPETTSEKKTDLDPDYIYSDIINPLTGEKLRLHKSDENADKIEDILKNRRPMLICYDNFNKAWPHSGISSADIGIEFLAEGAITRILGLFYSEFPLKYGPIRSARPYLVEKAAEFDAYFVHVGGSMAGLSAIYKLNIADLDGMSSGAFKRQGPKQAPHNTYATHKDLIDQAAAYGYRTDVSPLFQKFIDKFNGRWFKNSKKSDYLKIVYRHAAGRDSGYKVEYKFDSETGLYTRYMNGKPHIDELNEEALTCSNIIILIADHRVLDNEGRLAISTIGRGDGFLVSNGQYMPIVWKKDGIRALKKYYTTKMDPLEIGRGRTWIMYVREGSYVFEE